MVIGRALCRAGWQDNQLPGSLANGCEAFLVCSWKGERGEENAAGYVEKREGEEARGGQSTVPAIRSALGSSINTSILTVFPTSAVSFLLCKWNEYYTNYTIYYTN